MLDILFYFHPYFIVTLLKDTEQLQALCSLCYLLM